MLKKTQIIPVGLFITILAGYLFLPYLGYRRWDGLMTASVLHSWHDVPAPLIFFFAHPLIIPITKLFDIFTPFTDYFFIVVFREAFFMSLNAVLLYWVVDKIYNRKSAALLVALSFAACFANRWLVGCGEEKGTALFFFNLFFILYLMRQGIIQPVAFFKQAWFKKFQDYWLGGLLGLSLAVHLGNVLLAPFVLISVFTENNAWRNPFKSLKKSLSILIPAGIITLLFYAVIVFGINGIKNISGAVAFFTEYHSSGGFLKTDYTFLKQLVASYKGFRCFLFSSEPFGIKNFGLLPFECGAALALIPIIFTLDYRQHPRLTKHLGIYLAIFAAYYFSWEPWNPETWANAFFVIFILAALLLHNIKMKRGESCVWFFLLFFLLLGNYYKHQAQVKRFSAVLDLEAAAPDNFGYLQQRLWRQTPLRQIVSYSSKLMPKNAIVLLKKRFAASYFQLYYSQEPIVTRYLDKSDKYLKDRRHLTNLSRYFYTPSLSSHQISKIAKQKRPVYLLTKSRKFLKQTQKRLNLKYTVKYRLGDTRYYLYRMASL